MTSAIVYKNYFNHVDNLYDFLSEYLIEGSEERTITKLLDVYWSLYFDWLITEHVPFELEEEDYYHRSRVIDHYLELNTEVPQNYYELVQEFKDWTTYAEEEATRKAEFLHQNPYGTYVPAPRKLFQCCVHALRKAEWGRSLASKEERTTIQRLTEWSMVLRYVKLPKE